MSSSYFFGYGSLVNRLTHGFTPALPATARGWRRAWRAIPGRDPVYLTATPDPSCSIEGLIAPVPPEGWAALDLREQAYERRDARAAVSHGAENVSQMAIYEIAPEHYVTPGPEQVILLSYLDVVIQGYLVEYGQAGAERFFDTTVGWEAPLLDDRAAPRYPRAQKLSDAERAVVDTHLTRLGCEVRR